MRPRIFIGRFLIRLGKFIQSLPIMIMRPDDLVEFSRRSYSEEKYIKSFASDDVIDTGLDNNELLLLDKTAVGNGRLLLIGIGGGREAISLAQMGFEVTGIDFVPNMITMADVNARKRGVQISGILQSIDRLKLTEHSFDIVWFSKALYSSVPTQERRIDVLKRIRLALKPHGYVICQFFCNCKNVFSPKVEFLRKIFAFFTLGNLWYEKGDLLWNNVEFIHCFMSEQELLYEFKAGGFEISYINFPGDKIMGEAILIHRQK